MCASASEIVDQISKKGSTISFPEPPDRLKYSGNDWRKLLIYFGPGAILASTTLGAGETLFAPRGGAIFGLAILWTIVFAGITKAIMVYAGVRYFTLTGEHVMSRWAKMPGPRGWFPLTIGIIAILAFPALIASLSRLLGNVGAWIMGVPATESTVVAIGTALIVLTAIFDLIGGYKLLERVQIGLVSLVSVLIVVLTFIATPAPVELLSGLVPAPVQYPSFVQQNYPQIASRPVWVEIIAYMGAVGGGVYDYIGYVGLTKKRQWGMHARSKMDGLIADLDRGEVVPLDTSEEGKQFGRAWLKAPKADVIISFTAITLFTGCAMILGGVILYRAELVPAENASLFKYQARFFTRILPGLEAVWQIGVFAALAGTVYGYWEMYTQSWIETFKPFSDRIRTLEENRTLARAVTIVYMGGIGLLLLWSGISAVALLTPVLLVAGTLGCGLWCWAMLWTEKSALPKEWQGGWKLDLGLIIAGSFLTFSGILSILTYLGILTF
jgi:Mn2+/Fe2+ NRAMP family transporter